MGKEIRNKNSSHVVYLNLIFKNFCHPPEAISGFKYFKMLVMI